MFGICSLRSFLYFILISLVFFSPTHCVEEGFDVQEMELQNKRPKKSSSKFFNRLLSCLNKKRHLHMLWYVAEDIFQVKMVHRRNSGWNGSDISLFTELDNQYARDKDKKNYAEECKTRFKSNISKLSNYVKEIGCRQLSTSVKIRSYKILKFPNPESSKLTKKSLKGRRAMADGEKMSSCSTPASSTETCVQINNESHFPCLSTNVNMEINGDGYPNTFRMNGCVPYSLITQNPDRLSTNMTVPEHLLSVSAQNRNAPFFLVPQSPVLTFTPVSADSNLNHSAMDDSVLCSLTNKNPDPIRPILHIKGNDFAQISNPSALNTKNLDLLSTNMTTPEHLLSVSAQNRNAPIFLAPKSPVTFTPVSADSNLNHSAMDESVLCSLTNKNPDPLRVYNGSNENDLEFPKDCFSSVDKKGVSEQNEDFSTYSDCILKSSVDPLLSSAAEIKPELNKDVYYDSIESDLEFFQGCFPRDDKKGVLEQNQDHIQDDLDDEWFTKYQFLTEELK